MAALITPQIIINDQKIITKADSISFMINARGELDWISFKTFPVVSILRELSKWIKNKRSNKISVLDYNEPGLEGSFNLIGTKMLLCLWKDDCGLVKFEGDTTIFIHFDNL